MICFFCSQSEDGDGAFHIPAGKSQGKTAVPGFTLKFWSLTFHDGNLETTVKMEDKEGVDQCFI
jgi:hypothetical protein